MADTKISQLTGATTPLAGTEVVPLVQSGTTKKVTVANLTAGRPVTTEAFVSAYPSTTAPSLVFDSTASQKLRSENSELAIGLENSGAFDLYVQGRNNGNVARSIVFQPLGGNVSFGGNTQYRNAGTGVNFTANTPAAGMTSQLLNWYEEGTWTPTLTATTSGSVTITSPTNSMMYTRIGKLVTISGLINISSVSSPVGDLRLGGLPYNIGKSCAGSINVYSMLTNTTVTAYTFLADDTVADKALIRGFNNGAQIASVANNLQTGSGMYLTLQYIAA